MLVDAANKEKLCGFSDWRVPNLLELKTLVYCGNGWYEKGWCNGNYCRPTINENFFINTKSGWLDGYWSSSPYAMSSGGAWLIGFDDGSGNANSRNSEILVRLVCGRQ